MEIAHHQAGTARRQGRVMETVRHQDQAMDIVPAQATGQADQEMVDTARQFTGRSARLLFTAARFMLITITHTGRIAGVHHGTRSVSL